MTKYSTVSAAVASVVSVATAISAAHAAPAYNFGTRALSMGGAFTAQADDASAMFYNPAGIGLLLSDESIGGEFSTDGGTEFKEEDGEWNTDDLNWHFIGGYSGVGFRGGIVGIGCELIQAQVPTFSRGETQGLESCEYRLGYATALNDWFSIGGTLDLVTADLDNGGELTGDYAGTVGLMLNLVDGAADALDSSLLYNFRLGAAYSMDTEEDYAPTGKLKLRPERAAAGAYLSLAALTGMVNWQISANADFEHLSYLPAWSQLDSESSLLKLGGEFRWIDFITSDFHLSLRAGVVDYLDTNLPETPDREYAFGIGLASRHHALDLTTLEFQSPAGKEWGYSVAYSFLW